MPRAFVNGIKIAYDVAGKGEPLVLIMGFAGPRLGWIFQRRAFKRYFRVVTFDNRGVGASDRPPGPYSMRTMADDTIGLMDHLGIEEAHVLGISMGGMIAQEIAICHPQRVKRLILGCTFACQDATGGHTPEWHRCLGVDEGCAQDRLRSVDVRRVVVTDFALAFNRGRYRLPLTPVLGILGRLAPNEGARAQYEAILAHDTLDRLHLIKAPTLVIAGTGDKLIKPGSSNVLASRIPGARLVMLDNGSHGFFFEMRDRFNAEVLDFLRAGQSGTAAYSS